MMVNFYTHSILIDVTFYKLTNNNFKLLSDCYLALIKIPIDKE